MLSSASIKRKIAYVMTHLVEKLWNVLDRTLDNNLCDEPKGISMDCNGSNPGYIPHLHGGTNVTELALVFWTLPMKVAFLKMMKMEGKRGDATVEVIFATKTLTLLDG